jgi:hypothetical protein
VKGLQPLFLAIMAKKAGCFVIYHEER